MARNHEKEEVEEVEGVVVPGEQSLRPPRNCEVAGTVAGNQVTKPMPMPWCVTVMLSGSARRNARLPRKCEVAGAIAGNWVTKPMPIPWRATVRWRR